MVAEGKEDRAVGEQVVVVAGILLQEHLGPLDEGFEKGRAPGTAGTRCRQPISHILENPCRCAATMISPTRSVGF